MNMASENEERIQRASAGDVHAVDELLAQHLPGLRSYVQRNIGSLVLAKESSSDVVQSVCREVLQDVAHFEYRGQAAFRTWLYQAALRKIIDRHRYYKADKRDLAREIAAPANASLSADDFVVMATSLHSPSADAIRHEEVARLERAFLELSPADQRIVRWVYVEGLSHAQVAERLGGSEVNSRKQLSRALARLSKHLA